MKLLRFLLGFLFVGVLVILLLTTVLRFEILNTKTWTQALKEQGLYTQIEDAVLGVFEKEAGLQGRAMIGELINAEKLQQLVEPNLNRIFAFIKGGKDSRLVLYIPFSEWGIDPVEAQLPMKEENDVTDYFTQTPEAENALKTLRTGIFILNAVWGGSIIVGLALLFFFYRTGEASRREFELGKLLVISAIFAALGAGVFGVLAGISTQIEAIPLELATGAIYFDIGLAVAAVLKSVAKPGTVAAVVLGIIGIILIVVGKKKILPLKKKSSTRGKKK